jgi:hypothetical protein
MTAVKRRGLLAGAALGGLALGTGASASAAAASGAAAGPGDAGAACQPAYGPATIRAADLRYQSMVNNGHNRRFVGKPEQVRVVTTTAQVIAVVNEAVAARKRIVVRSGGHCFENFTATSDIQILLDMSQMAEVFYDERRRAFQVEAGATLGEVYRTLFKKWGVTIPAGSCFDVGAGGHFAGGGYGHLSRRFGLVVDHLHAVEVVTVDRSGRATAVVATSDPGDPHRDLWWAHTGGGGGNFGVVTRYWLRTPGATSNDPTKLLPAAPSTMLRRTIIWPWESMTQPTFSTLLRNFCTWYENNDVAGSPTSKLWSTLQLYHSSSHVLGMVTVADEAVPGAAALVRGHVEAVTASVGVTPNIDTEEIFPWMTPQNWPSEPNGRYKHKGGDLRKGYNDRQIEVIYRYLTDQTYPYPNAFVGVGGFGGQVNAVAPEATATAERTAILRVVYSTGNWASEADDALHLDWVRRLYRDVYADTGGVPVPNRINAGTYINYPDNDLSDPAWNRSGMPWHALFYQGNYPRLQTVKRRYDPRDVFHHAQSVALPT